MKYVIDHNKHAKYTKVFKAFLLNVCIMSISSTDLSTAVTRFKPAFRDLVLLTTICAKSEWKALNTVCVCECVSVIWSNSQRY